MIPGTGRRGACCPATRLNNDADANPLQGPAHRKTRKPYRIAMRRKIISVRTCNSVHACVNARTHRAVHWRTGGAINAEARLPRHRHGRVKPGHDDSLICCSRSALKLLRGQALRDMSDFGGKVSENCGKSHLETLQIRKLLRDWAEVSCGAAAHVLGCLHSHNRSREAKGFTTLVRR